MQWLIDIVKEWVEAKGYLTGSFVNRGDPDTPDITELGIIGDDTPQTWDISSVVPVEAKAVLIFIRAKHSIINKYLMVWADGQVNNFNRSQVTTQVADQAITAEAIVPMSGTGNIIYKANQLNFDSATITIKGWWF